MWRASTTIWIHLSSVRCGPSSTLLGGWTGPSACCGEMAGDPAGAILLLGMGIDTLSMTAACVPRIKWVIRTFTATAGENNLRKALTLDSAEAIHQLLHTELEQAGLGDLVTSARFISNSI